MDQLPKIVARIERRLKALGIKGAAASTQAGLSNSAIQNLRRGALGKIPTKGGNATTFSKLAPVLKTSVDWLTTGNGPETVDDAAGQRIIRVKGYAGASGAGHIYAVSDDDLDEIPTPDITADTIAIEIKGDSLGSIFDRWYVLYDERRDEVTPDMIGKLCVVGLTGDRVAVKVVEKAGKRFNLLSETGKDDIRNVAVEWAARVKVMVPR